MNIDAFLATLRHSEGTDLYPNPYAATFACNVTHFMISDFSDHPHALGWPGYLWNGIHDTASGAYQITYPTWITLKARLHLADFTPPSQDAAAIELIRETGALDLVNTGQVVDALSKCRNIWASLPGSQSGQPQAKMSDLVQFYTENGGGFA
ncbi:MAG: glycoside hydrolase family 104 protein [Acidobacteriaceae bacterium]